MFLSDNSSQIFPNTDPKKDQLSFIDLFCGCGGFTLGMERAGFDCLAAIDFNQQAVEALHTNLPHIPNVLHRDLTAFSPEELARMIGERQVDVIVGGPPCQGFSMARKRDGANHGVNLKEDPRRHLYQEFLKYVEYFKPKVFVMENVLGIKTAAGGKYFTRVQSEARALGYLVHGQVEDAWVLGVPQKRRRQLIIGTREDLPGYFIPTFSHAPRAIPRTLLGPAICDLPGLKAGEGCNERPYDLERREAHLQEYGDVAHNYLFNVLEIERAKMLTNHVARPHSERDLRDFELLFEGENSAVAMRDYGIKFEFPYDKSNFKDRYTRQSRRKPCSTIVAHLSKDGLMFIHPTQNRSITPREAARIQSFPDWFRFPDARTHSFRLIGNAVPPLIAEAVGLAVISYLNREGKMPNRASEKNREIPIPTNEQEALDWLLPLLDLDKRTLRNLSQKILLKSWTAISFLYSGLHPDGALERGTISNDAEIYPPINEVEPRLLAPYYETSGWPVVLVPVAEEANRRFNAGELYENEFYCCDAQIAGMTYRNSLLLTSV